MLPIPPGTHWSEVKPLIFPALAGEETTAVPALPAPKPVRAKREKVTPVVAPPHVVRRNGLCFDIPQPGEALPEIQPTDAKPPKAEKVKAAKVKRVCDPRLVSAARELRDRWLEQVNGRSPTATPMIGCEKYAVTETIEGPTRIELLARPALPSMIAA